MSQRMNFLRSIIESSSNASVDESSERSLGPENRDSGYQTGGPSSSGESLQKPGHGRGRARFTAFLAQPKSSDDVVSLEGSMQSIVIGGRGRFVQKLLSSVSDASRNPSQAELTSAEQDDLTEASAEGKARAKDKVQDRESSSCASLPKKKESYVPKQQQEPLTPVVKQGTAGTPVQLMSNFMELKCEPGRGIFLYTVDFIPNLDSKQLRKQCVDSKSNVFGKAYTFDGRILLLPKPLGQEMSMIVTRHPSIDAEITMQVVFRAKQSMSDNVTFYNKLFRRIMHMLQLNEIGRKHFDSSQARIVPQHKLEIWPGFVTAVNAFEGGLMLNLDVTHRVLMQTTVYTHIKTIAMLQKSQFKEAVIKSLLGVVVLTRYNKKTYRIDDICFDANPMCTFRYGDRDVTYVEYYKQHYDIDILDHQQPLLLNRSERRVAGKAEPQEMLICLIPEICYLTGLTDEMRKDYKVMRDIATYTRISPNQRLLAMEKFCENVNNNEKTRSLLASWGLELKTKAIIMDGRQLPHENIRSGGGVEGSAGPGADFNRQVTNNPMLEVVHIRHWTLVYTQRDEKYAMSFTDCVKRSSRMLGIDIAQPTIEIIPQDSTNLYVQLLRTRIRPDTQIVVIICPTNRDDRYAAIKRICCTEVPIPTQIINARTLSNEKRNRSIVLKILLQMNCKLGGTLWGVNIPLSGTMICGIDTYHEAKHRSGSVSAFVGSIDASFTRWYSRATVQERKEELMNGLCVSMEKTLQAYRRRNCQLPEKIIIFRDGVSDSQMTMCEQYEIPQLLAACNLMAPDYEPKITFIVVQKRIITRMFNMSRNSSEGSGNAPPGTVLDHTVTRRFQFDYFLVAQAVQMGTVTPTHYIVLRNDSNFSPDILQRLSYKMCYMYYNWPGSIRVPACCQYAHKLAYLIGQSVKRMPAESLNDKLFYL
ncbi:protein argonaute-3 [Anopheles nili]|uniref:protein argonaute-3 n=1 Tax=Anopheles nili TaxID=185578 RepID=UPI00237A6C3F|nr:protein argonaute-3 [Anopheles nili]